MNSQRILNVLAFDRVFQKQTADVEVCKTEGKIAAADLEEIRPVWNDFGKLAEAIDETFGRRLDFGHVRRFESPTGIFQNQ